MHNKLLKSWKSWKEKIDSIDRDINFDECNEFHEIIVPTVDSMQTNNFLKILVQNKLNACFIGPTGTGKTAYVSRFIKSLDIEHFICTYLCLSAKTTCNQIQEIIESKLEKKARRVYGAPFGK